MDETSDENRVVYHSPKGLPMKTILLAVLVAAFFSACSDFGENPEEVYAVVDVQTIAVNNTTNRPIHIIVMGANFATLANWAPGCNANNEIPPGLTLTIDHSLMKSQGERFAIVYWWDDCREVDGIWVGQDIHALRVGLP